MIWLWTCAGLASGFEVAQQSAVAGGTAHAGTARSTDPAAAWLNPAALADDGGFRGAVGAALAVPSIAAEAPDGSWAATTRMNPGTPPHLYASYSDGGWVGALSVNAAFASGIAWPERWPGRFDILASSPTFFRVAPSVGRRLGVVSLAVGVHLDVGALEILKATDHVSEEGSAHLLLRGRGIGADAAAFVDLGDVDLGLSYKGRTGLDLGGEADFDVPAPFTARYPDQAVGAAWTLPDRLVLGVSWTRGPVTAVVDAGLTWWSVNDTLVLDFAEEGTDDVVQDNAWRDALALRLGGELTPDGSAFTARAGVYGDGLTGAPPPAETLSPSSPDSTRLGITAGGGYRFGGASVDAFAEHMRLLPRTSQSPDALPASYRGSAWIGGVSVSWRGAKQTVVSSD